MGYGGKKDFWAFIINRSNEISPQVDLRIGEFLEIVDPFKSANEALAYLTTMKAILSEMLSDNLWIRIGSLKYACLAYTGSRILRKAFFKQNFIMPPRIDGRIAEGLIY